MSDRLRELARLGSRLERRHPSSQLVTKPLRPHRMRPGAAYFSAECSLIRTRPSRIILSDTLVRFTAILAHAHSGTQNMQSTAPEQDHRYLSNPWGKQIRKDYEFCEAFLPPSPMHARPAEASDATLQAPPNISGSKIFCFSIVNSIPPIVPRVD
jgi:hypothetical protein